VTDTPSYIGLSECVEHEDGSATYKVNMDEKARDHLCQEGLTLILHCAAANVDIADVYDWLLSQIPKDEDIRPMTDEERQRSKEREEANKCTP